MTSPSYTDVIRYSRRVGSHEYDRDFTQDRESLVGIRDEPEARDVSRQGWESADADVLELALVDREILSWQERALCAQTDPEAFFPEKGGSTREAKKVCLACEVRVECLEYALAQDERFGIWGGLSERERRRLKKRVV